MHYRELLYLLLHLRQISRFIGAKTYFLDDLQYIPRLQNITNKLINKIFEPLILKLFIIQKNINIKLIMINYVDELKPKANKLLLVVSDLQQSEPEKIIELGLSIQELLEKGEFPEPIEHFFTLPIFQELLSNLKTGRWISPEILEKKRASLHTPLEIQTIQRLVEAFHKLVHLCYNQTPVDDPIIQAKILASNVFDYLVSLEFFLPYKEKNLDTILAFLFRSIGNFSIEFKNLLKENSHVFSKKSLTLTETPLFENLTKIDIEQNPTNLITDWYPILSELNINPELAQYKEKMKALASANAHKVINQLQTLLGKKSIFYQKTLPIYVPYDIKKELFEWLDSLEEGTELPGQKLNEFFTTTFWQEKYAAIDAKQSSNHHKFQYLTHQFWPLKETLFSLTEQYHFSLPRVFTSYLVDVLHPFSLGVNVLGKPKHLAVQLLLGFYSIQHDYLSELLDEGAHHPVKPELKDLLYEFLPTIFSFFEMYYKMNPASSFYTIKQTLEHLYSGEEAIQLHPLKEIKKRAYGTFELLIPKENGSQDPLGAFLHKIIHRLTQVFQLLTPHTPPSRLLLETTRKLEKIDFPSYSQTWYVFGEMIGAIFIILSQLEDLSSEKIRLYLERTTPHPFLKVLFS